MEIMTGYMNGNKKVAIIGAGYVGASIAYALTLRDVAREIVLIDIDCVKADGEAKDIRHGLSGIGTADLYAGDYTDCADCDLIIITAGRGRKPGESRLDLAADNVIILRLVIQSIQKYYTGGVVLIVSNPVDILTYKATEWMGLQNGMVFGSGCILDSSRFVRLIADYVGLSAGLVSGYIAGEHGDHQVPIWSQVTVGGIAIAEYCEISGLAWDELTKTTIAQKIRTMGAEIIAAKGRTHFGIATCVCQLADAIINMHPTITSVSSALQGEYGCQGMALSVPSVVGPAGVQQIISWELPPEEYNAFSRAANTLRDTVLTIREY